MKKILVLLVALLMVGCEAKDPEKPKQIIEKAVKQEQQIDKTKEEPKQEQQVDKPKEEVKEKPKGRAKQVEKELPKKEEPKKKEQDDNIDPETGLAKVKDGTHLEEEARQASNKAGYSAVEAEANREARIAELEAELAQLKNEK